MSETHGAINDAELAALGLSPHSVLDVSSNCLPGAAHPSIQRAVQDASLERYPSLDAAPLRARIAERHVVSERTTVVGAGAAQLIFSIVQACSREGDAVVSVAPSFGEYADAARALRRRPSTISVDVNAEPNLADVFAAVQREQPALVFVCQPNNPTGRLWQAGQIERLAECCAAGGGRLVVDHAYRSFVDPAARFDAVPGAINLYSLTKDFKLAGLRLGYLVADADVARSVQQVLPPWSVSSPALAAGCAALEDDVIRATDAEILAVQTSARALWQAMRESGLTVLQSDCHFALIKQPEASVWRHRMLCETQVQVRSAASFGLPDHVRVCSKGPAADARLLQAWNIVSGSLVAGL